MSGISERLIPGCACVLLGAGFLFTACGPPRIEFVAEKPEKKPLGIPEPFPVAYTVEASKDAAAANRDLPSGLLRASSSVLKRYFDEVSTVAAVPNARAVFTIKSGDVLEGGGNLVAVHVVMRGCDGEVLREATGRGQMDKSSRDSKQALGDALAAAIENAMQSVLGGNLDWMNSLKTCRVGTPALEAAGVDLPVAATGTGFFVNEQGDIVTAHHVVSDCDKVGVVVDGIEYPVNVAFFDATWDLALLRKGPTPSGVAELAVDDAVVRGKEVVAFGFPLQGLLAPTPSLTTGMLSNDEVIPGKSDLLQLSAPISPGNSGGPLIGIEGGIYGVTVSSLEARRAIAVFSDGTILIADGAQPQNVNFAVGVSRLRNFLKGRAIPFTEHTATDPSTPVEIGKQAKAYTVIVLCRDAESGKPTKRPESGQLPGT